MTPKVIILPHFGDFGTKNSLAGTSELYINAGALICIEKMTWQPFFFYAFIITHIKEVLLHGKQIQKRKIHYAISN